MITNCSKWVSAVEVQGRNDFLGKFSVDEVGDKLDSENSWYFEGGKE